MDGKKAIKTTVRVLKLKDGTERELTVDDTREIVV